MNVPIEDPRTWNRIVPYLDQALDLDADQVDRWLDDLQNTQPEIAAMVQTLLAELDMLNAIGFLATPIVDITEVVASLARRRESYD